MDTKKLITEYRQLQQQRNDHKLVKKKLTTFKNVQYQTESQGVRNDVTIEVRQGLFPDLGIITFEGVDFQKFFEDCSSFNDKYPNEAALSIVFEEDEIHEDIHLVFGNKNEKERFSKLLKNFCGLSDRSTPDSGSGSGSGI